MATSAPYISWTINSNPVLGKLKLQSMERSNIFFEDWVHLVAYDGGMDDRGKIFPVSPYSLNKNYYPKKVHAPLETTIVKGIFQDSFGDRMKKDVSYTLKVFVWVETEEESNGVDFGFQEKETEEKPTQQKNA